MAQPVSFGSGWQAIGDVRHDLNVISGATCTVLWRRAMPIAAAVLVTAIAPGGVMWLKRAKEGDRRFRHRDGEWYNFYT